jgi:phosphoribosylpyrophosphate synthetase
MTPTLTIRARELAAELGCAIHLIHKYRARQTDSPLLRGLPEPISARPVLVWHRQDIIDWLESRRTFRRTSLELEQASESEPAPAVPNRPRKVPITPPATTTTTTGEGGAV